MAVEKVDQLINLVGELVIIQSMLTQHSQHVDQNEYSDLLSSIVQLERIPALCKNRHVNSHDANGLRI